MKHNFINYTRRSPFKLHKIKNKSKSFSDVKEFDFIALRNISMTTHKKQSIETQKDKLYEEITRHCD